MLQFLKNLVELKRDEKGVTALEYALIAALIGGVIVTTVTTFGSNLTTAFNNVGSRLTNAGK